MEPLSLVMAVAVFASAPMHTTETPSPATEAPPPVIPALYTPDTMTPAAHEFIARCDDEAFSRTRFPKGLADQCERLLARWHQEALAREAPTDEWAPTIPHLGNALRFSTMYTSPPQAPARSR